MTKTEKNKKAQEIVTALTSFLNENLKIGIIYDEASNTIKLENYDKYLVVQALLADYGGVELTPQVCNSLELKNQA